jgi:hypothetical protein
MTTRNQIRIPAGTTAPWTVYIAVWYCTRWQHNANVYKAIFAHYHVTTSVMTSNHPMINRMWNISSDERFFRVHIYTAYFQCTRRCTIYRPCKYKCTCPRCKLTSSTLDTAHSQSDRVGRMRSFKLDVFSLPLIEAFSIPISSPRYTVEIKRSHAAIRYFTYDANGS